MNLLTDAGTPSTLRAEDAVLAKHFVQSEDRAEARSSPSRNVAIPTYMPELDGGVEGSCGSTLMPMSFHSSLSLMYCTLKAIRGDVS